MIIWTAFLIGFLGSFHCAGMCGPIAISLPHKNQSPFNTFINGLLYNLGRIATYTFLGVIIGIIGKGFFLAGMQRWISMGLGILLLIIAIFSINVETKIVKLKLVNDFNQWLSRSLGKLLKTGTKASLVGIGVLNGFLPCGLVYMAIAGAVSNSSILDSIEYMVFFGLGTMPMMLGLSVSGRLIPVKLKNLIRKAYPVFLILFAILFILRGLNFDVPLEIQLWHDAENMQYCH